VFYGYIVWLSFKITNVKAETEKELKSKHISIPLSSSHSPTENIKIQELKNNILELNSKSLKEFKKDIIDLIIKIMI
jgi:hypothetical protein